MIIPVVALAVFLTNTPAFSISESALIDQLDGRIHGAMVAKKPHNQFDRRA